jgi:phosphocarrier protein
MNEVVAEARIRNKLGLHARPAAEIVRLAQRFQADIRIAKDDQEVPARSIMALMMLAAEPGSRLTIRATGPDADEAVRALKELIDRGFDEE